MHFGLQEDPTKKVHILYSYSYTHTIQDNAMLRFLLLDFDFDDFAWARRTVNKELQTKLRNDGVYLMRQVCRVVKTPVS
jgi:hypothetical protein